MRAWKPGAQTSTGKASSNEPGSADARAFRSAAEAEALALERRRAAGCGDRDCGGPVALVEFEPVSKTCCASASSRNSRRPRAGASRSAHSTGGLTDLEAEAGGIVIHGLEDPGEAPYAQVESLRVRISILGFFSPRILLRELEVLKPQIHLIVYPDGSTNQPHPKSPKKARQAGHARRCSICRPDTSPWSRAASTSTAAPRDLTLRSATCRWSSRPTMSRS